MPPGQSIEIQYSESDWGPAAGHRPLAGVDVNQIVLLHRHWIWANLQRRRFDELLPSAPSPSHDEAFLASEAYGSMYLWYGLLWVVIEGFQVRSIDLRGRFADDIERLAPTLRPCRNAIFHVPERNHDPRLFKPMEMPDSVPTISRVSTGFGRLFLAEAAARRVDES
jgi:hypothetical protein